MARIKDLTGMKFNKLVAIKPARKDTDGHTIWEFKCECGGVTYKRGTLVTRGIITSCGCDSKMGRNTLDYRMENTPKKNRCFKHPKHERERVVKLFLLMKMAGEYTNKLEYKQFHKLCECVDEFNISKIGG